MLLSIILLAVVLRLWGIWHGYPYSYYGDEAHFVKRALSFGSGDFNPHWFHKPAFYMYVLFFEYGIFFIIGKIIGLWSSINDFAVYYINSPGLFYLIGRVTTALFSVGSVFLTYVTAKELFNRRVGLIAALMLSLSFGHVMVAKDVKADTPCMFFTVCSVYFLIIYMKEQRLRNVILSSIFAGVGTATKSYTILMLIPIILALIGSRGKLKERARNRFRTTGMILMAVVVFYAAFFVCSPYNFLDPLGRQATFSDMNNLVKKATSFLSNTERESWMDEMRQNNILEHATVSPRYSVKTYIDGIFSYVNQLYEGMGFVFLVMFIMGVPFVLMELNKRCFIFFLFPFLLVIMAIFMHPGYSQIRHQIVIYPFLVILGAVFFFKLLEVTTSHNRLGYVLLGIMLLPLYSTIQYDIYISKEDTRNIAKRWIEQNIPAGSRIVLDESAVILSPDKAYYEEIIRRAKVFKKSQFTTHAEKFYTYSMQGLPDITYDISYIRFPWWQANEVKQGIYFADTDYDVDMGNPLKSVGVMPYELYREKGYQYVITDSFSYMQFKNNSQKAKDFPSFNSFYNDLFKKAELVKEFDPVLQKRPGPIVKIFKIS